MPTLEAPAWTLVRDAQSLVSECPVWCAAEAALYWADVYGPSLHRFEPGTGTGTSWPLPARIGSFALRPRGALVALDTGLFDLDFSSRALVLRHAPPQAPSDFVFNDGRCDSAGRFWVGTSHAAGSGGYGGGWFYRVDATSILPQIGGLTIANGMAFSPDGRTAYTADSRTHRIHAHEVDPIAGTAGARRVFAQLDPGDKPDGAAVDAAGGYWTAVFGRGRLLRFDPDGRLSRVVRTPTLCPTMVAFGGADLRTVFITSARKYPGPLTAAQQAQEVHAGGIWCCDLGVRGRTEPMLAF